MDIVPVSDGILSILFEDSYAVVEHHVFRQYRIESPYDLLKKTDSMDEKLSKLRSKPRTLQHQAFLELRELGLYLRDTSDFTQEKLVQVHTLTELRSIRDSGVHIRFLTYKDQVLVILDEVTKSDTLYYETAGTDNHRKLTRLIRKKASAYTGRPIVIHSLPRIQDEHKYIQKTKQGVYTFLTRDHPQYQQLDPEQIKKIIFNLTEEDRNRQADQSLGDMLRLEGIPIARQGNRVYKLPLGSSLVLYCDDHSGTGFFNHLISQQKRCVILTKHPRADLPVLDPQDMGIDFLSLILDNFPEEYLPLLQAIEQIYDLRNFSAEFQTFLISYMETMTPEDRRSFTIGKLYHHLKFSKPEELQTSMTPSKKLTILRFFEMYHDLDFLEQTEDSYIPNIIQIRITSRKSVITTLLLLHRYLETIASEIELLIIDDLDLTSYFFHPDIQAVVDPILNLVTKVGRTGYPQRRGFDIAYKIVDTPTDQILDSISRYNTDRPYLANAPTYLVMPNNQLHSISLITAEHPRANLIEQPQEQADEEEMIEEEEEPAKTDEQDQADGELNPLLQELKRSRDQSTNGKKQEQSHETPPDRDNKPKQEGPETTDPGNHTVEEHTGEKENTGAVETDPEDNPVSEQSDTEETPEMAHYSEPPPDQHVIAFNHAFQIRQLVDQTAAAENKFNVETFTHIIEDGVPLMQLLSRLYYSHTKKIAAKELDLDRQRLEYADKRSLISINPDQTILLLPRGRELIETITVKLKELGRTYTAEMLEHIDEVLEYQRLYGDLTYAYSVMYYPIVIALGYYDHFRRLPPLLLSITNVMTKLKDFGVKQPKEFGPVFQASIVDKMTVFVKDINQKMASQLESIEQRGEVPRPFEQEVEEEHEEVELDLVPEPLEHRERQVKSKVISTEGQQPLALDQLKDGEPIVKRSTRDRRKTENTVLIRTRAVEHVTPGEHRELLDELGAPAWKDDCRLLRHISRVVAGDYEIPTIMRRDATSKIDMLWSFSIHHLRLKTQISNILFDHGLTTVQDLVFNRITTEIKGIGKKSLEEIERLQDIFGNMEYLRDGDIASILDEYGIAEYIVRGGYIPVHQLPPTIYYRPEFSEIKIQEDSAPLDLVEQFFYQLLPALGLEVERIGNKRQWISIALGELMEYQRNYHKLIFDEELQEIRLGHVFKYQDRYLNGDTSVLEKLFEEINSISQNIVISPIIFNISWRRTG